MRNVDRRILVPAVLAIALGACADEPGGTTLSIEVMRDPDRCSVRSVDLRCANVAVYLRDELHIDLNEFIEVTSDPAYATFEATEPVIDSLKQAGFTTVIGSVTLDEGRPKTNSK